MKIKFFNDTKNFKLAELLNNFMADKKVHKVFPFERKVGIVYEELNVKFQALKKTPADEITVTARDAYVKDKEEKDVKTKS